jgi:hypothetical protein
MLAAESAPASAPAPADQGQASGQVVGGDQGTPPAAEAIPAAGNDNWYSKVTDADLRGYIENKGWKDPSDVATGYRNLEKLIGSEKVPLPKSAEDLEGWNRVYDSLGRPKTAEDYKLPVPEGDPGTFAKAAAAEFHKAGISQSQAEKLSAWWNQTQTAKIQEMQQQAAQKAEADLQAVRAEWGNAYAENVELGRRAAREFGLDGEKLAAIENGMGTGEMLKFMARLGRGLTEHNFEGGKSTGSFGMTPDAARSKISELQNDREWASKYINGNADGRVVKDATMRALQSAGMVMAT